MATNYPSGLDSLSNPAGSDALSTGHASQHANANDAIEAIEGELGLNPRGGSATVKARFDAIEANSWVTSARIADGTITGTDIASGTVTSTNILDGTIVNADINASAAIDVSKLSGVVSSASVGNLVTTNQASFETDTTGWVAGANSTIARTTATALSGSACLEITCTGAGDASVATPTASSATVTPGRTYTGVVSLKAATTGRISSLMISWYTSGSAHISSTTPGTATTSTSAWATIYTTGVAPATAAYARLVATVGAPGASEVHYLDCAGVWQGAGGLWALPGTPIANLGFYTDESAGRRLFQWDANNARFQQTFGDTGLRDITASMNAISGVTWNYMYARRNGSLVEIRGKMTTTGAIGSSAAYTVPSGFIYHNSVSNQAWTGFRTVGVTDSAMLSTTVGGTSLAFQASAAGLYAIDCVYTTTDAWPSSLPGSAVGSIPNA